MWLVIGYILCFCGFIACLRCYIEDLKGVKNVDASERTAYLVYGGYLFVLNCLFTATQLVMLMRPISFSWWMVLFWILLGQNIIRDKNWSHWIAPSAALILSNFVQDTVVQGVALSGLVLIILVDIVCWIVRKLKNAKQPVLEKVAEETPADAVKVDEDWEIDDIDDLDLEDDGTAQTSTTQNKEENIRSKPENKLKFKNAGEDLYFSVEAAGTSEKGSKAKKKRSTEK